MARSNLSNCATIWTIFTGWDWKQIAIMMLFQDIFINFLALVGATTSIILESEEALAQGVGPIKCGIQLGLILLGLFVVTGIVVEAAGKLQSKIKADDSEGSWQWFCHRRNVYYMILLLFLLMDLVYSLAPFPDSMIETAIKKRIFKTLRVYFIMSTLAGIFSMFTSEKCIDQLRKKEIYSSQDLSGFDFDHFEEIIV